MHFTTVFQVLQRLLLLILCLSTLHLVSCNSDDDVKNYSNELCLNNHNIFHRLTNENYSTKAVASVAQTRAYLSPAVFLGTLKSLLVQRDGTVRAWFTVNSPLKLNATRTRSSRKEDTEVVYHKSGTGRCALELNQDKLILGSQYLVFGSPSDKTSWPSMTATALPIPNDKRTLRAVKKLLCKGCAKPPTVSGLQRLRVTEGSRVRLNCHLAGYPIPWIEWYKDSVKLASRGRVKVRTKRRTSRLVIRKARPADRGVYECRAGNVVQGRSVSLRSTLTVTRRRRMSTPLPTIPTTQSSPWTTEPCPTSDFCLNGGTCVFYKIVREYVCQCAEGYVGLRCDYKDVSVTLGGFKNYSSRGEIP